MSKKINNFNKLLHKLKYKQDIPGNVKQNIVKAKYENFKIILKRLNKYSYRTAIMLFIYFLLRGLGLKISYFTLKILIITVSTMIVGSGSYVLYEKYLKDDKNTIEIIKNESHINNSDDKKISEIKNKNNKSSNKVIKQKIADDEKIMIYKISSPNNQILAKKIAENLYQKLSLKKTGKIYKYSNKVKNHKYKYLMIGNIVKLDKKHILNIKIVNNQNKEIVFSVSNEINVNQNNSDVVDKIVSNIIKVKLFKNK